MLLSTALTCLAANIYYESRGEPMMGQVAVAMVTMNRANHDVNKICSVVTESKQFSWTIDRVTKGKAGVYRINVESLPTNKQAWDRAKAVAFVAMNGWLPDVTGGSNFYHAKYVSPKWRYSMKRKKTIGNHIFYRGKYGNNK